MFTKGKPTLSICIALALFSFTVFISSCSNTTQIKPKTSNASFKSKVIEKQSELFKEIVIYDNGRERVFTSQDERLEALSEVVMSFTKFDYAGGIRWADSGNYEYDNSTRNGVGVLVSFAEPWEPLGKPYNDQPYKLKRLYIPLSGELVEGNFGVIVLHSPSETKSDWDGFYVFPVADAKRAITQLHETVKKLSVKDVDEH